MPERWGVPTARAMAPAHVNEVIRLDAVASPSIFGRGLELEKVSPSGKLRAQHACSIESVIPCCLDTEARVSVGWCTVFSSPITRWHSSNIQDIA